MQTGYRLGSQLFVIDIKVKFVLTKGFDQFVCHFLRGKKLNRIVWKKGSEIHTVFQIKCNENNAFGVFQLFDLRNECQLLVVPGDF